MKKFKDLMIDDPIFYTKLNSSYVYKKLIHSIKKNGEDKITIGAYIHDFYDDKVVTCNVDKTSSTVYLRNSKTVIGVSEKAVLLLKQEILKLEIKSLENIIDDSINKLEALKKDEDI